MNIQWYPGHMAKTKRMITENISLVDIVIEILDARIPLSSKNPDIDSLAHGKKRIVILNKSDLSDDKINHEWKDFFEKENKRVIIANSVKGTGINEIWTISNELMQEKIERLKKRGRIFVPIRAMIVGIPNVGKSTVINKSVKKAITKTGDRPGVTTNKQWVRVRKDFELLDTPGILWPKFEDPEVGLNLAFTGAVKDDIMDMYQLGVNLSDKLKADYPQSLENRYKISITNEDDGYSILEKIADARGFIRKGGVLDTEKAAIILLDEFRAAKLGRISLERPMF